MDPEFTILSPYAKSWSSMTVAIGQLHVHSRQTLWEEYHHDDLRMQHWGQVTHISFTSFSFFFIESKSQAASPEANRSSLNQQSLIYECWLLSISFRKDIWKGRNTIAMTRWYFFQLLRMSLNPQCPCGPVPKSNYLEGLIAVNMGHVITDQKVSVNPRESCHQLDLTNKLEWFPELVEVYSV